MTCSRIPLHWPVRKQLGRATGLERVAAQILGVVRPQGSPLIVARDVLLHWGVTPPVITDSYWLDVVEASNRVPGAGAAIPEESHWGRWSFPLPPGGDKADERGERLAWTAMQLAWTAAADERSISPLNHPDTVHEFIHDHPGLWETCAACPDLLAEYAPQLTIPGFESDLLEAIEEGFAESCRRSEARRRISPTFGTATTVDGSTPACDEEWTARHPEFGRFEPAYVANAYFAGGIFGPDVSPYEHADHLFWLLSDSSTWLPPQIRKVLIEGMATWGVWRWTDGRHINGAAWPEQGEMFKAVQRAIGRRDGRFVWNVDVREDLRSRIKYAIDLLSLPNTAESIMNAFVREGIVEKCVADEQVPPCRDREARG
jgi:hypothetical protein